MLKGPEALDEFMQVTISSISAAEAGNSMKLFAREGPRKSRGSISTCGISSANIFTANLRKMIIKSWGNSLRISDNIITNNNFRGGVESIWIEGN